MSCRGRSEGNVIEYCGDDGCEGDEVLLNSFLSVYVDFFVCCVCGVISFVYYEKCKLCRVWLVVFDGGFVWLKCMSEVDKDYVDDSNCLENDDFVEFW